MPKEMRKDWKYVVLFASFLTTMFSAPLLGAFGVFVIPWMEHFSGSAGAIALITSCGAGFSGIGCPIGSLIAQKWGYQKTLILGGICLATSFMLSTFAQTLWSLFFTYSLLGGIGNALACVGYVNAVNDHFPRNLGVAFAITNSGYGIGGFLFPLLFEFLMDEYTWRGAMFITGAIMGNLIVCGCLVFPSDTAPPLPCSKSCFSNEGNPQNAGLHDFEKEKEHEKSLEKGSECKKELEVEENMKTESYFELSKLLFKSSSFYIMVFHNMLNAIGYFIPFGLTSLRAHYDLNLTEKQTTILISTLGLTQLFSRPLMAIPVHFKWIRISSIYFTSHFVVGAATLMSLCARSFPTQLLYCIVFSVGWSCMSFYLVVVKTVFGSTYYNVAFGHLEVMHGMGCLLGPFVGGAIFDVAGSSQYAFVFAGLSIMMGSMILIFGLILTGRKHKLVF